MNSMLSRHQGFTFIELIVTVAILAILASATLPLLKMSVQRTKETELKENLRTIRKAIDAYKQAVDEGKITKNVDASGYPASLELLVGGVENAKSPNRETLYFLRKIPRDPMLVIEDIPGVDPEPNELWGLRSYQSSADEPREGKDVYDVYSLSEETGLNGVPYAQW